MVLTPSQQTALAVVPKVSSILSLLGSGWIMIEVLFGNVSADSGSSSNNKRSSTIRSKCNSMMMRKIRHPYHRLLLAMSIYDVLESVWNFASTWPLPADEKSDAGEFLQPIGTRQTCTAQGFFLTLSVAVPIYNAFLSLYYLLVINYRFTDSYVRLWIEPTMHVVAFVWAFGTAVSSVLMGLINNANLWCWIAPYPSGCMGNDDVECTRGRHAYLFRWVYYFGPLWFCIFSSTVFTLMVYWYVRQIDLKSLQYRIQSDNSLFSSGPSGIGSGHYLIEPSDNDEKPEYPTDVHRDHIPPTESEQRSAQFSMTSVTQSNASQSQSPRPILQMASVGGDKNDTTTTIHLTRPNLEPADKDVDSVGDGDACPATRTGDKRMFLTKGRMSFLGTSVRFGGSSRWGSMNSTIDGSQEEKEEKGTTLFDSSRNCTRESDQAVVERRRRFLERWKQKKRAEFVKSQRRTVEVFHQALYYLGAFYLTHIWSTTTRIIQQATGGKTVFGLTIIHSFFDPFQGFLNYVVYQRPRYLRIRKERPGLGKLGAVKEILRFSFFPVHDHHGETAALSEVSLSPSPLPPMHTSPIKLMLRPRTASTKQLCSGVVEHNNDKKEPIPARCEEEASRRAVEHTPTSQDTATEPHQKPLVDSNHSHQAESSATSVKGLPADGRECNVIDETVEDSVPTGFLDAPVEGRNRNRSESFDGSTPSLEEDTGEKIDSPRNCPLNDKTHDVEVSIEPVDLEETIEA